MVKVEVRLILHELSAAERHYLGKADVGVAEAPGPGKTGAAVASASAPMYLRLPAVEVERHASLEIRDRRNRRLVTVVELLSPSNKTPGADRDDYLAKRRQVLAGPTHFVEIDLRRGGTRPDLPPLPPCDYYVLVSRYEERPVIGFWPISLHDPLPEIPVPLSPPDPDVPLNLRKVLDLAYDGADYGKYIYQETPDPPLSAEDNAWASQFVPARNG